MHEVRINGRQYNLPSKWDEIDEGRWKPIADFLLIEKKSRNAHHRAALAKQMLQQQEPVDDKMWNRITPQVKWELGNLMAWVETDLFTRPMMEHFKHEGVKYYVPQDKYSNVRMIEYVFADVFYNRLIADTADTDALNKLVATLCRPPLRHLDSLDAHWDGDPREPFSPVLMEQRAAAFTTLHPHIKLMVCLQFIGCTNHVHEQYKILFPEPKEEEVKTKPSFGRGVKMEFGWMETLHDAVATGWFGDWDKTAFTFMHKILYHFAIEKAKHIEVVPNKKLQVA